MSAAPYQLSTAAIEPALRDLANNAAARVKDVAKTHRALYQTADATYGAIWDWLRRYNGGRREFSVGLISRMLEAEGKAAGSPAPTPAKAKAARKPASVAAPAAPVVIKASRQGHRPLAVDDGASPWTKHPQGPRSDTMKRIRPGLECLAAGMLAGIEVAPSSLTHWLGTTRPPAAKVARFLAWCDARPPKVAAPAKPRASRKVKHLPEAAGFQSSALDRLFHGLGFKQPFKLVVEVRLVPVES